MAPISRARPSALPWTLRLFESSSLPPGWIVLAFAALYVVAWRLWFQTLVPAGPSAWPVWGSHGWAETVIRGLLLGYTPALVWMGRRGTERDLEALRPVLGESDEEFESLVVSTTTLDRRTLRWVGLGGAVGNASLLTAADVFGLPRAWSLSPALAVWDVAWMCVLGWLLFRALAHDLRVARTFSRLGEREVRLDLLDMRAVAPLARWGLRTVLLWVVWFAILSLFWLGPGTNLGNALGAIPMLVVAVAALLLPVHGLRRRVRSLKRRELDRVGAELRRVRDEGIAGVGLGDARLANLFAYRSAVEAVREWPFDVSTLLRFALYVALGAGSWLGAALVERGLDRFLDRAG